jgi:hypothetical protein
MKTKSILAAVLITAAAFSAQAGVRFGIAVGVPCPAPVVVAPVVVAPVTPVVAARPCPGPGYVWTAGYWSGYGYSRVWVPGSWLYNHGYCAPGYYHYAYAGYGHPYGWRR